MKIITVTLLSLGLIVNVAMAQEVTTEMSTDYVVATVDGKDIMYSDVKYVYESNPQLKTMPFEAIFSRLLEDVILTEVVAMAGINAKIEDDAEFQKEFEIIKKRLIAMSYLKKKIYDEITETKLRDQYRKYIKNNPPQDEVKARHILVEDEAKALDIIEKLNKGADFAQIANEASQDIGADDGGDLGWFTKETMVSEFADAAFKLKKGEFSEKPVKTQFGWHIVKVDDKRKSKQPEFEEIEDVVKAEYIEAETEKFMKDLKESSKIKSYGIEGKK